MDNQSAQKNAAEGVTCSLEESASLKASLLETALCLVAEQGWRQEVLVEAAQQMGYGRLLAWALFPGGCGEAIDCWSQALDAEMVERLAQLRLEELKVRERVFEAVRIRLELLSPLKETTRRTVRFLRNPRHASQGLSMTARTVDAMWRAAGDISTDYNYYTKRALLSGVYGATLLHWLKDDSQDGERTWLFLKRRIDNVLQIGRFKGGLRCNNLSQFLNGLWRKRKLK